MTNFAPRKWEYRESIFDSYCVYDGDTEIALVPEEKYARLIESAPELYWTAYNLLFELKRGNGLNPEYIGQIIPQIEDLVSRIRNTFNLKLCPSCGEDVTFYMHTASGSPIWRVQCRHCGYGGWYYDSQQEAADAWNNRRELSHD